MILAFDPNDNRDNLCCQMRGTFYRSLQECSPCLENMMAAPITELGGHSFSQLQIPAFNNHLYLQYGLKTKQCRQSRIYPKLGLPTELRNPNASSFGLSNILNHQNRSI